MPDKAFCSPRPGIQVGSGMAQAQDWLSAQPSPLGRGRRCLCWDAEGISFQLSWELMTDLYLCRERGAGSLKAPGAAEGPVVGLQPVPRSA